MFKLLNKIKFKSEFHEGFREILFLDDSWGFMDKQDKLLARGFRYVYPFSKGFAPVQFHDNSWGYIDNKGNIFEKDQKTLINKNDPRLKGIEVLNFKEKINKLMNL